MQIVKLWTDSFWIFIPGASAPRGSVSAAPCGDSPCATVSVQIVAAPEEQPVIVSVSLDPYVQNLNLVVDEVKHETDADTLKVVISDDNSGRFAVTVEVPAESPAGTYRGDIRDIAKVKRGELTVEVRPSMEAGASRGGKSTVKAEKPPKAARASQR